MWSKLGRMCIGLSSCSKDYSQKALHVKDFCITLQRHYKNARYEILQMVQMAPESLGTDNGDVRYAGMLRLALSG